MSIVQAILLGVLYWIGEANLPFVGLWTVQRPLVCGWIAGIILGDALTGAMVGASINLVYLGFISAGGSMPADMALAGTLGAAFAITGNLDADTALALAVPIGLLGTLVWYCRMTFDSIFVHIGDRFVEKEQYNKIWIANVLLPQIMAAVICIVPCSLAAYFRNPPLTQILQRCYLFRCPLCSEPVHKPMRIIRTIHQAAAVQVRNKQRQQIR